MNLYKSSLKIILRNGRQNMTQKEGISVKFSEGPGIFDDYYGYNL